VWASNNLWLISLCQDWFNGVLMSSQAVNLCFCSDIPYSCCSISSSSYDQILIWMHGKGINTTEMSMILSDYFILLQIPALDLLIFTCTKQIRMPIGHCQSSDCIYMTSQCNFELPTGQIPKLNSPIIGSWYKEPIKWINGEAPDPSGMPTDDSL